MTYLFYFSAIIFIINHLLWIFIPTIMEESSKKFSSLLKEHKGKSFDLYSKELKSEWLKRVIYMILSLFWVFIGLFSSQWVLFIIIVLFNFGIIYPILTFTKNTIFGIIIKWISHLMNFFVIIFLILNHYHLHIDVWAVIKTIL